MAGRLPPALLGAHAKPHVIRCVSYFRSELADIGDADGSLCSSVKFDIRGIPTMVPAACHEEDKTCQPACMLRMCMGELVSRRGSVEADQLNVCQSNSLAENLVY